MYPRENRPVVNSYLAFKKTFTPEKINPIMANSIPYNMSFMLMRQSAAKVPAITEITPDILKAVRRFMGYCWYMEECHPTNPVILQRS